VKKENRERAIQYFNQEYLNECSKMKPQHIIEFLENFSKATTSPPKQTQKLISMRVPEDLLLLFKHRSKLEGIPYQSLIKKLMRNHLGL